MRRAAAAGAMAVAVLMAIIGAAAGVAAATSAPVGNNLNVPEERYVWLSFLVSSVVVFVSETRDSYTWSTS
jgi:hypothetical protein